MFAQETTRDGVCKALATAFLDMIPMPKNDDHSDVSLGPLLDNFKDVKSDARVQAHDNDSLRLMEEKFRIAHTTSTDNDDGAVEAATKDLRVAVQNMEPAMREVITEANNKKGRTLERVRVATAGNLQFSKVSTTLRRALAVISTLILTLKLTQSLAVILALTQTLHLRCTAPCSE